MPEPNPSFDFDIDKAAEMTLALMALGIHDEIDAMDGRVARTWKGFDWDVLTHLHQQGHIANPASKAKSVVLTPQGLAHCRTLFDKHFGKKGR